MGGVWLKERLKDSREHAAAQQAAENSGTNQAAPASPSVAAGNTTDGGAGLNATQIAPQNAPQSAAQNANQGAGQNSGQGVAPSVTQGVPQNAQNAGQSVSSAQPVATGGTSPVGLEKSSAPVEISISATARAWISVRSDGKTVETLTLDPEKPEARTRSYKANEKLTLVVGNPAGLSVTYNGKPAGTLGTEGHPATITFTPHGMEKQ